MAFKPITTPRGSLVQNKNGSVRTVWNDGCAPKLNKRLSKAQARVDSEVLRRCAPLIPKRTGALERSGTLGTVIGSGEVKYIAPYARQQYYNTLSSRDYDPHRGGMWFERMKLQWELDILRKAEEEAGLR